MRSFLAALCLVPALSQPVLADPVISEFCASNQNGIRDEDGDRPDWIEIYNPDAVTADLTNWYLTDNLAEKTKWRFPAASIPPGGYLVVFASGKNKRVPGQPLHTGFSLSADGEYLGLIRPNGNTVASHFSPEYPGQFADISYGTPSNTSETVLVAETAAAQWIVPTSASNPAITWKNVGFNPAGWNSATLGIGYDRDSGGVNYVTQIGGGGDTDSAMTTANNPSCYIRVPFNVPSGTTTTSLKLQMKYDDGFAVWLNGQPLLSGGTQVRRNALTPLAWNSAATQAHVDSSAEVFEDFDVTESLGLLTSGQNVLAIHGFNRQANTTDFFIRPQLIAETTIAGPAPAPGYFATPTPGARNAGTNGLVIPQEVVFSKTSGTFSSTSFNLTLSGAISGQEIRYTLDGSMPTASSTLYSGAINISNSALVRARIHAPATGALGFVGGAQYEKLGASLASYSAGQPFKSALPIVVLNNRGLGEVPDNNEDQSARIQIYDRDASGYASLSPSAVPVLSMSANVKLRGRSSSGFPKKSYGIELLDESNAGKSVEVLGMPAGEDWALIGGWDFDRAFMRNAWIYEVSRQAGRWAPRTRLVEVFFNQNTDGLNYTSADYRGVYILCENIRRSPDRVDVANIDPSDVTLPRVSGGYIFKVDAGESDEFIWRTSRNLPTPGTGGDGLVIHRPKRADLPTQQSSYLVNYFQDFEDKLFTEASSSFSTRSYRNYIDSAAWADHNLFCMLAKNVDALRLSAYFHKDRGAPMAAGPLWDFDRSGNSTDSRDDSPTTWTGTGDATNYFQFSWWQQLFQDVEFRQLYVDRWQAMRRGTLSNANVGSILDGYLAEFKPADGDNPAKRDYLRWYGSSTSNDISNERSILKNWLISRSAWIDQQFVSAPTIVRASGPVAAGDTTTITAPSGTTVYYTTDGTDPRAEGGSPSASAIAYNGTPVSLPATMKVIARAWKSGSFAVPATNWSGPVESLYLVNETYAAAGDLRISAICYNPLAPDADEASALPAAVAGDFEWIELKNVGSGAVNLQGVSLGEGAPVAKVVMPAFTLAPGARGVIVKDRAAFGRRYGSAAAARIIAEWPGDGSLDNAGEAVHVYDRGAGVIAEFSYDDEDDWPERADGDGSALEYTGSGSLTADYENPLNWKASDAVHGSPGVDTVPALATVKVNEILSNTVAPQLDTIELFNTGGSPVNIGGWYLGNVAAASGADDYRMYRIPNGTVIPAGEFLVFSEQDFNPNGEWNPSPGTPGAGEFSLDGSRGGKLWLVSADAATGKLHNFEQAMEWTPVLPGVSYGSYPDGASGLAPLSSYTPAASNTVPRVGPVQVSEIHYFPAAATPEFVEISNTGSASQSMAGWTLRGDVDFDFPAGFTLAPAEAVVVVSFDPVLLPSQATAFRTQYSVPAMVRLVGPWSPGDFLRDAGGEVRLRRLVPPPADEPNFVGLMVEDEVLYSAQAPWPTTAAGTGSSIRRLGVRKQGSDPSAWVAGLVSPGTGVNGYAAWSLAAFGEAGAGGREGDADGDGLSNFVEYLLGSDPSSFSSLASSIDPNGGNPRFVLNYSVRKDRDDGMLGAYQASDLQAWLPAANDELIQDGATTQARRAWLPLGDRGFLRLEASEAP
ncbi:lamin tail domain-containing protein [Luteolibacter luteus]|uniref:LTD domain-containing protein n=1 Tax=Luteolibacter luteus TaxID=2728835 RepID=A0A858REN4_9BACT|nr:lamin tail domain-containing protein [Luteolibacter luteus]QJE94770.1 hypothetical protein HHL09_02900 [Luteolibacter luteus]